MTKSDIVQAVSSRVGFSKRESAELVEDVLEIIKERLEKGEAVKLSGFGSFLVRKKRSRPGRNPKTGESVEITARRVLTFKPSPLFLSPSDSAEPRDGGSGYARKQLKFDF